MPRRRGERLRIAVVDAGAVERLRPAIRALVTGKTDSPFRRLSDQQRWRLVQELVDALAYALAGVPLSLKGKRSRLEAWRADILMLDVGRALRQAEIPVLMNPDHQQSHAQLLAYELLEIASLEPTGELFHQIQRAREIEHHRVITPMIEARITMSDGTRYIFCKS